MGSVQPLEWVKHPIIDAWRCDTMLGTYKVFSGGGIPPTWDFDGLTESTSEAAATADDALAAAQADYAARILSAVTDTPDLRDVVRELVAEMQDFVRRVDAGEVRSVRTYARFKTAIAKAEGVL